MATYSERLKTLERQFLKKGQTPAQRDAVEKKILRMKLKHMEEKHALVVSSRKRRETKRQAVAVFQPRFTEGKRSFESLLSGKALDVTLSDEVHDKVVELVAMVTEDDLLAKYTTWEMRAVALGISPQRLYTLRQTRTFQTLLVQAIRAQAMMGVAESTGPQKDLAKAAFAKGSTLAYAKLASVAGMEQAKSVKVTQNNITLEQSLRSEAMKVIKVVDAEVKKLGDGS